MVCSSRQFFAGEFCGRRCVYAPDEKLGLSDYGNVIFSLHANLCLEHGFGMNGLFGATHGQLQDYLRRHPLEEVEQRYLCPGGGYYWPGPDGTHLDVWRDIFERHPAKVARLNACVRVINACKTETSVRMAINEIVRLLYGKERELCFDGEEYDLDRLLEQ